MLLATTHAPAAAAPSLLAQAQSFITGVVMLDPAQAALRGGLTLLVFFAAALLLWGLHLVLKGMTEHLAPAAEDEAPKRRHHRIGHGSLRIARWLVFIAALVAILRVWGLDLDSIMNSPIGGALATAGRIALIVVLALVGMEVSQLAITQVFSRVAKRAKNLRRASQLRTLAPVLVGVASTTIVIVAAMMALSQVGVEIAPLLAGAGIVGLAIGFGAQTIVKDFLTGIFLILEDAVSVGDTIRIGESSGTVEEMSIRTIKLRDYDGTLHVFPYSEAQVLHNRTKGFSYTVFEILISNSAQIAPALDLMKKVGDEIKVDPANAGAILHDIEIAGVDKLSDAGILLKGRMRTAPGAQWRIGRAYLHRIKLAFDAEGIETPVPSLKLLSPEAAQPAGGTAPPGVK